MGSVAAQRTRLLGCGCRGMPWCYEKAAVACWSVTDEAVTIGGFDDESGGGHGGEALIERCGTNTAGCAKGGERLGVGAVGQGCGNALVDGTRLKWAVGPTNGLDRLEGKGIVAL